MHNKQKERLQRGIDFQDEVRRSWRRVPNVWRLRLRDGKGGTQVADEVALLAKVNLLSELKRTEGDRFELSFLRSDQINGLLDFDRVLPQNYGLVLVSFHNLQQGRDDAYAIRLITALHFMRREGREYITLDELRSGAFPAIRLPRLNTPEPTYDLWELGECYRYL